MYLFYQRVWERVLHAAAFVVLALIPIAWTVGAWSTSMMICLILITPVSVCLLPIAIFYIYRIFSSKPGLVINDAGITINMNFFFWKNQFIPWSSIGGVAVRTHEVYQSFFTKNCVTLSVYPVCRGRFSQEAEMQMPRKWFQWGRLGPPCEFGLIQKGLDAEAIRAAIQSHGKLYK